MSRQKVPGVYRIRCGINGKVYIGSSVVDVYAREKLHFAALRVGRHICRQMQSDFNAFGESLFEFSLLAQVCDDEVRKQEEKEIAIHRATDESYGYNKRSRILPFVPKRKTVKFER